MTKSNFFRQVLSYLLRKYKVLSIVEDMNLIVWVNIILTGHLFAQARLIE